jgi:hypothetical protein
MINVGQSSIPSKAENYKNLKRHVRYCFKNIRRARGGSDGGGGGRRFKVQTTVITLHSVLFFFFFVALWDHQQTCNLSTYCCVLFFCFFHSLAINSSVVLVPLD